MRGSPLTPLQTLALYGIIPAHAGLTAAYFLDLLTIRDHPRACGAHSKEIEEEWKFTGSSPRMRGSPSIVIAHTIFIGIIPAHAGLTCVIFKYVILFWDHPRACGAHIFFVTLVSFLTGSSPRMRGSRYFCHFLMLEDGIIPAHAGLTSRSQVNGCVTWDHPRACGAHSSQSIGPSFPLGSSPRMRGSLPDDVVHDRICGIIPAHAGLTERILSQIGGLRDHPRACGAHEGLGRKVEGEVGSSPRMRGSLPAS